MDKHGHPIGSTHQTRVLEPSQIAAEASADVNAERREKLLKARELLEQQQRELARKEQALREELAALEKSQEVNQSPIPHSTATSEPTSPSRASRLRSFSTGDDPIKPAKIPGLWERSSTSEEHKRVARRSLSSSIAPAKLKQYFEKTIALLADKMNDEGKYDENDVAIRKGLAEIKQEFTGIKLDASFEESIRKDKSVLDDVADLIDKYCFNNGTIDYGLFREIFDLLAQEIFIKKQNRKVFFESVNYLFTSFIRNFEFYLDPEERKKPNQTGLDFIEKLMSDIDKDNVKIPGVLTWYHEFWLKLYKDEIKAIAQDRSPVNHENNEKHKRVLLVMRDKVLMLMQKFTPFEAIKEQANIVKENRANRSDNLRQLNSVLISVLKETQLPLEGSVDDFINIFDLVSSESEITAKAAILFVSNFFKSLKTEDLSAEDFSKLQEALTTFLNPIQVKDLDEEDLKILQTALSKFKIFIYGEYRIKRDKPIESLPGISSDNEFDQKAKQNLFAIENAIEAKFGNQKNFQDFLRRIKDFAEKKDIAGAKNLIKDSDQFFATGEESLDKISYFVKAYRFLAEEVKNEEILFYLLRSHIIGADSSQNKEVYDESKFSDQDILDLKQIFDKWSAGKEWDDNLERECLVDYPNPMLLCHKASLATFNYLADVDDGRKKSLNRRVLRIHNKISGFEELKEQITKYAKKEPPRADKIVSCIRKYDTALTTQEYKTLRNLIKTVNRTVLTELMRKFFSTLGDYTLASYSLLDPKHMPYDEVEIILKLINDRDGDEKRPGLLRLISEKMSGEEMKAEREHILKLLEVFRYKSLQNCLDTVHDLSSRTLPERVDLIQRILENHKDVSLTQQRYLRLSELFSDIEARTVLMINYFKKLTPDEIAKMSENTLIKLNNINNHKVKRKTVPGLEPMLSFIERGGVDHMKFEGNPISPDIKEKVIANVRHFLTRFREIDQVNKDVVKTVEILHESKDDDDFEPVLAGFDLGDDNSLRSTASRSLVPSISTASVALGTTQEVSTSGGSLGGSSPENEVFQPGPPSQASANPLKDKQKKLGE